MPPLEAGVAVSVVRATPVPAGQLGVSPAQMAEGRGLMPRARSPTELVTAGVGVEDGVGAAIGAAAGAEVIAGVETVEEWEVTAFAWLRAPARRLAPSAAKKRASRIVSVGARGRLIGNRRLPVGSQQDSRPRERKFWRGSTPVVRKGPSLDYPSLELRRECGPREWLVRPHKFSAQRTLSPQNGFEDMNGRRLYA